MSEHVAQTELHRPAEQRVNQGPAGKLVRDPIRKKRLVAEGLELVAVNPRREGTFDLFIDEQPVLLINGVQRDPAEGADLKLDPGAGVNSFAGAVDHSNRRKRGREQRQRIGPFVKAEDFGDRGIEQDTLLEHGHTFSLTAWRNGHATDEARFAGAGGRQ